MKVERFIGTHPNLRKVHDFGTAPKIVPRWLRHSYSIRDTLDNANQETGRDRLMVQSGTVPGEPNKFEIGVFLFEPKYKKAEDGSWLIRNLNRTLKGGDSMGCVSNAFPDGQWRIAHDPRRKAVGDRNEPVYTSRHAASLGELQLALEEFWATVAAEEALAATKLHLFDVSCVGYAGSPVSGSPGDMLWAQDVPNAIRLWAEALAKHPDSGCGTATERAAFVKRTVAETPAALVTSVLPSVLAACQRLLAAPSGIAKAHVAAVKDILGMCNQAAS